MPRLGMVDARFQSYNVEMVEVTGGRFWAPYAAIVEGEDRYQYRSPIDLGNPKLRMLAAALGPAYVRVSGTWANHTYFSDSDPAPSAPPPGFTGVLKHQQWRGVVDFARAVDARILVSMAVSAGTRDAAERWLPDQARRLFAFTKSIGATTDAVEFMNEPNAAEIGGAPKGYDADAYARDFNAFQELVREVSPQTLVLGPGSIGDKPGSTEPLAAERLLAGTSAGVDALAYHFYGAASRRCSGDTWWPQTRPQDALSEDWLGRTGQSFAVYRALRDTFLPGKPIWLTETADTVCGGNPWASTFLDTFRYLDQLGRLAQSGVQVVMHNTLAASDYGMLDEKTFEPRPNYWAAWLWRKLMGETVLDPGVPIAPGLHVYAHGRRDAAGGVALMALNTDRQVERVVTLPVPSQRYTLSADDLQTAKVKLNGTLLRLGSGGVMPALSGIETPPGPVTLAPATITFLTTGDFSPTATSAVPADR